MGRAALNGASKAELYRSREVAQILGISRRQLQYWAQTDLVRPSARSPGGHHRYTFQDLIALKAAKRLLDAGVSVQRLRKGIGALRRILPTVNRPLAELVLVATGDIVLVLHEESAFEAATGQEWIFEVAQFQRELEIWKREPRPLAGRRSAPSTGSEIGEAKLGSGSE
jgi:DNA-binding transcriptional MerR regulator